MNTLMLLLRWLPVLAVTLPAAAAGFDFGARLAGPLFGAVLALNAAVMAAVLMDGTIDRMLVIWRRARA